MDMKKQTNAIQKVEQNIKASYRRFFDLDEAEQVMPDTQLRLFLNKAKAQHLLIAIKMRGGHQALGYINHQISDNAYVMHAYAGRVDQIVRVDQTTYIKRAEKLA